MEDIKISIPDINFNNDFTIIYKGRGNNKIQEIKTSKDELIRRLRYFKKKIREIEPINEYYIHDEFDSDLFKEFIKTLEHKEIKINEHNYFEIYKLSQKYEFIELQAKIEEFIEQRPDLENIIETMIKDQQNNKNKSESMIDLEKEKIISQHLDFFLEHGNLFKLSNSVVSRILNSPERILKNHHLLFNFIKTKLNENIEDQNLKDKEFIQMMIGSLDCKEMTNEEINELLKYENVSQVFQPRNSNEFILTLLENNKSLEKRLGTLENKQKNQEIREQNKEQIRTQEYSNLQNKINELEKMLSLQTKQISYFEKLQNQFNELENKLEIQTKQISEYEGKLLQLLPKPVTSISINSETEMSNGFKIINLTAKVEPPNASNKRISWEIIEEQPNSFEVLNKTEEKLKIKILKGNQKVTISANSEDGSGIFCTKEIKEGLIKTEMKACVESKQVIKCEMNINKEGIKLDTKRSKYLLNDNKALILGEESYNSATPITKLQESMTFYRRKGTYYLHAIIFDEEGLSYEIVSEPLSTEGSLPLTYEYKGKPEKIELESGEYKLEVWGAQGGTAYHVKDRQGGKGGYSVGTIKLGHKTHMFVYVGGQGIAEERDKVEGGFNGGGYSADPESGYKKGVGGGGTDIRINGDSLYSRVIVAGGGGGGNGSFPNMSNGGSGGGENGEVGSSHSNQIANASPGTQSSGGKPGKNAGCAPLTSSGISIATGEFGQGGSVTSETINTRSGAGGGGWYGGGAGNGHGGSGSGGSGWVFTQSNYERWKQENPNDANKFLLDHTYYLRESKTISGNNSFPTPNGNNQEQGHAGNGYAKISPI